MKHPNKGMSAVKVPQRRPELMETKETNGIFMRYWNVYNCSGEISCWINHWVYSCLWNPFHLPEATRSDIPPALPRLPNTQRRQHTADFMHMLSEVDRFWMGCWNGGQPSWVRHWDLWARRQALLWKRAFSSERNERANVSQVGFIKPRPGTWVRTVDNYRVPKGGSRATLTRSHGADEHTCAKHGNNLKKIHAVHKLYIFTCASHCYNL